MPRCGGRHSRQTCRRAATQYTDGIGRCMFHSMQRSHYLWFAMLAGCAICFGHPAQARMVEFYCCGKFYCYNCVMRLYDAARQCETGTAKCPTCRCVIKKSDIICYIKCDKITHCCSAAGNRATRTWSCERRAYVKV